MVSVSVSVSVDVGVGVGVGVKFLLNNMKGFCKSWLMRAF